MTKTLLLCVVIAGASHIASAQALENRIAAGKGSVGFEFTTRRNVCGNGMSINISDDSSSGWTTRSRRPGIHIGRRVSGEREYCEEGPAKVILFRNGGKITAVNITVGEPSERADTELGVIAAPEAARYLLAIAPGLTGRAADHAVMGAAIADSATVWRRMLEIARDNSASEAAQTSSLFWVSQEASAAATVGLDAVASDDDAETSVRTDALFFLAQRPNGEGIPALIRVVQESKSMKLRKDAIWHLSQSRDSRAIELFETLLAGR